VPLLVAQAGPIPISPHSAAAIATLRMARPIAVTFVREAGRRRATFQAVACDPKIDHMSASCPPTDARTMHHHQAVLAKSEHDA
jgi:hypothetical protein